jgi:hypothetical protein
MLSETQHEHAKRTSSRMLKTVAGTHGVAHGSMEETIRVDHGN